MRKNARRKVLALLLAVMTVGQSLSLTSFADSSTPQTDSSISAVGTQSNETRHRALLSIRQTVTLRHILIKAFQQVGIDFAMIVKQEALLCFSRQQV